jgi:hypothetical protein
MKSMFAFIICLFFLFVGGSLKGQSKQSDAAVALVEAKNKNFLSLLVKYIII